MAPIHPALLSRNGKEQFIKAERLQYIVNYLAAHPETTKQQLTTHLQEKFNISPSTAYRWERLAREHQENQAKQAAEPTEARP